ncbi:MAG: hypothetical protein EXQ84_07335 [Rhodospirillaceae bacterium]|nr:hypothetical protein [Rhodospirillaceae bacterium]
MARIYSAVVITCALHNRCGRLGHFSRNCPPRAGPAAVSLSHALGRETAVTQATRPALLLRRHRWTCPGARHICRGISKRRTPRPVLMALHTRAWQPWTPRTSLGTTAKGQAVPAN